MRYKKILFSLIGFVTTTPQYEFPLFKGFGFLGFKNLSVFFDQKNEKKEKNVDFSPHKLSWCCQ